MSPIFTDPSITRYLDLMEDSSTTIAFPNDSSLVLSLVYSLHFLDPFVPPSLDPSIGPYIYRSTRVSAFPYLIDYYSYFALSTLHEPRSYYGAHTGHLWKKVMFDELDVFHKNHNWDMVDLSPSQSIIGCKCIYKIKTDVDGSIE